MMIDSLNSQQNRQPYANNQEHLAPVVLPQPVLDNKHLQQPPPDLNNEIRYAPVRLQENVANDIIRLDNVVVENSIQREQLNNTNQRQQKDDANRLCSICMENQINCAFIQCGHACCCNECGAIILKRRQRCPICRADVEGILKIYVS